MTPVECSKSTATSAEAPVNVEVEVDIVTDAVDVANMVVDVVDPTVAVLSGVDCLHQLQQPRIDATPSSASVLVVADVDDAKGLLFLLLLLLLTTNLITFSVLAATNNGNIHSNNNRFPRSSSCLFSHIFCISFIDIFCNRITSGH